MSNRSLTQGLIISVFMDHGPDVFYNSSPLDETDAFNLVIKNLPAITTDVPESSEEIRSYGPIPTPRKPYLSSAFYFFLKAQETDDPRVKLSGRIVVFWFISTSRDVMKYAGVLKRMIRRNLRLYGVNKDVDLQQEDVMKKIDEKLSIVEVGVEAYYLSEGGSLESFSDFTLIPEKVPIVLIDGSKREIRILLQEEASSRRKMELRQIVKDFRLNVPMSSSDKYDFITEPLTIQVTLSKLGLIPQAAVGEQVQIHVSDELTFEDLYEFIESQLAPQRRELTDSILKAVNTATTLDFSELSEKTGISVKIIEQILVSAIERRLIQKSRVERGKLFPSGKVF